MGRRKRNIVERYVDARSRWTAAGKPVRSEEEVRELLSICKSCPFYKRITRSLGRCGKCGCALNLGQRLNKLYWATERCPDDPPRWQAKFIQAEDGSFVQQFQGGNQMEISEGIDTDHPALNDTERVKSRSERKRLEREERRAARAKRRAEKEASRAKLGTPSEIIEFEPNQDQLHTFDRNSVYLPSHPLRDYWRMNPAFLVCGGPSVKGVDISLLEDSRVCSIAVNNIAGFVKPKAFVYSDPTEKFHGGVFLNPGIMKFVPLPKLKNQVRLKDEDGFRFAPVRVRQCPSVWGFERNSYFDPETFLIGEQAQWGCSKTCPDDTPFEKVLFTPFLGLRLLHYLGVRTVFLLGVDFDMSPGVEGGYAFNQARTKGAARSNNDHYRKVHKMFEALKPVFDEAGFNVYNCNNESRLSVFPYYPYEKAVEHCLEHHPDFPYDLSGWYEKDPSTAPSGSSEAS